jgi:hypothetical protein
LTPILRKDKTGTLARAVRRRACKSMRSQRLPKG